MVQAKVEINEFDLVILAGVAKSQTLKEIAVDLGGQKQTSFVQYRLNRLQQLGYVMTVAGKARSRLLTDKGREIVEQYLPKDKIRDWRVVQQQSGD